MYGAQCRILRQFRAASFPGRLQVPAGVDVAAILAEVGAKNWEVFAKPFEEPAAVYDYLSRSVHQVAISNYRLEGLHKGRVRFRYYDNRERTAAGEKGPEKIMSLPATELDNDRCRAR